MRTMNIALDRLRADARNANVMPEAMLVKLTAHIERTGRYPAVIVRPALLQGDAARHPLNGEPDADAARHPLNGEPDADAARHPLNGEYVIVDGHHRVQALGRLSQGTARCEVWDIDEDEAAVLLATLNRLEGGDDPKKRAKLAAAIARCGRLGHDAQAIAKWLPERTEQVQRLLEMRKGIESPRRPEALAAMPEAVHFFLVPEQRRRLEARLREIGGGREEALMEGLGVGD